MPICAVLFAEFDVEKGPIISHCHPEDYVDDKLQQQLKHLLIPKPILYNHKMCFTFGNLLFIGHPMCIKGHKYKRNELLFNLVLVVDQAESEPSTPYITALEKLANSLRQLEDMDGWVWKHSKQCDELYQRPATASLSQAGSTPLSPPASFSASYGCVEFRKAWDRKVRCYCHQVPDSDENEMSLCAVVERVYHDLNRHGRVVLPVNPANVLTVRLREPTAPLAPTPCHQVPVIIYEPECYHQLQDWDMTCEVVKGCIDGEKYVPLIAEALGMTVKHVQVVLGTLQRHRIVALADIFQFSNRYVATEKLADFSPHVADPRKKRALARALNSTLLPAPSTGGAHSLLERLLRFYGAMTPDSEEPVGRLQAHLPTAVDLRRAVQFGVVHRILRRVHEWPIVPNPDDVLRIVADAGLEGPEAERLAAGLRDRQCLDALCVALRRSRDCVLEWLQPHVEAQRCYIIHKP